MELGEAIATISREREISVRTLEAVLEMRPAFLDALASASRQQESNWIAVNYNKGGQAEIRLCPAVSGGVTVYPAERVPFRAA